MKYQPSPDMLRYCLLNSRLLPGFDPGRGILFPSSVASICNEKNDTYFSLKHAIFPSVFLINYPINPVKRAGRKQRER